LGDIREHIVDLIEAEGNRVLEIGVGTGTQTLQTLFSWNQKTEAARIAFEKYQETK